MQQLWVTGLASLCKGQMGIGQARQTLGSQTLQWEAPKARLANIYTVRAVLYFPLEGDLRG